jgi:hypothetical protein
LRLVPSVPALPVAMIQPSFQTLLVSAIGTAPLAEPDLSAAGHATIALSAITMGTEKENGATFTAPANSLPQNYFALSRHACPQAGLDNGNGSVAA